MTTFANMNQLAGSSLSPLAVRQTERGVTWSYICRSGVANPDSQSGVYAGDAESYTLFWEELRPIIARCHNLEDVPLSMWCKPRDSRCPAVAAQGAGVQSTRMRVARNLAGFGFPSAMRQAERVQVYWLVQDALREVPGTWFELATLSASQRRTLARARLLFTNEDRFMASANIFAHWPLGRAIFVTSDQGAAVWVNEEDHLRIMAIVPRYQPDVALAQVRTLLAQLENRLEFAWSPRLGYLTSCPSNLGTGLRASVLAQCTDADAACLRQLGLHLRGTHGEHTSIIGNLYDISPRQRLGVSERGIVQQLDMALRSYSHII